MINIRYAGSKKLVVIIVVLVSLILSGCTTRGWPGITGSVSGDIIFAGTLDGRVKALNSASGSTIWTWPEKKEDEGGLFSCAGAAGCTGGGQFRAGSIYGPPAVADGIVYVGAYTEKVYAINATNGSEFWEYDIDGSIVGGVAVANGTLFFGTSDKKLYALDAGNVTPQQPLDGFPFEVEDKIWSAPVVQDGIVYFGSLDHKLYAVDASTGTLKWDFETDGGIAAIPLILDGVVYIGSFDSKFYAIDADSGQLKWVFEEADDWYWAEAVYRDGIVYACSLDNKVYAIYVDSGLMAWSVPFETSGPISASPVISGGVLVVVSEKGDVYGIDLGTGNRKWTEDLDTKVLSPLFESKGKVYINGQNNKLYTIDSATGNRIWEISLGD